MKNKKRYDPKAIEKKWQKFWLQKKTFFADQKAKGEKEMVLIEFPYPSGAGLHVGHMRSFIAGDVTAKYWKLRGKNTMYPIGWDAFGLPAENFAIKNKVHPSVSTKKNVANAKRQLISWGTGFDWSREINTTDPEYYKWTQKIFLELFEAGLAYEKEGEINWCPKDKTGLANEEVIDGKCERCGTEVEKKNLRQWYLKITDFAEKLLEGLNDLPEWPEAVKIQQANWIGKSEGSEIEFKFENKDLGSVKVFTTRADTLFGVTYLVLAPEMAEKYLDAVENKEEVKKYIDSCRKKTDLERTAEGKTKTGVPLKGIFAMNPANDERIPVWTADYVLGNYGTGGVMAVPGHDERDYEFAKKFQLPIKNVIDPVYTNPDALDKTDFKIKKKIVAIVEDAEGKVLCIHWKKELGGHLLLGGTMEEGETPEETALRELREETGYTDAEIVEIGDETFHYRYFAYSKGIAFDASVALIHLKLKSHDRKETALEDDEKEKFTVEWITKEEALKHVTDPLHKYVVTKFIEEKIYTGDGIVARSGAFSGKTSSEARKLITDSVHGNIVSKYKLRDWVFSRQRYWGEPIPLIHCDKCGIVPVPDKDLPVKLPNVKNYEPTGTGESPLAAIEKWVEVDCPKCVADQKKTKYLVFDFDGVIGDTFDANLQARIDIGWAKDLQDSREKMLHYFTNRPHHANGHAYTEEEVKNLMVKFKEFGLNTKKHGFKIFVDFVKEIKKIKNAKIAVISSGSNVYVHDGVKESGLKSEYILTCEDSLSKEDKLEFLAKKWKVGINDLYYFTDSTADVYELESIMNKRKIIGCSWGYIGFDELKKALPDNQILKKPKEIHEVLKLKKGRRETNTMPQWAGSSWYWLRYMDPKNKKELSDVKMQKYWSPVDLYFGGMEHTTLHLLYSRFWNLFLYDRGLVAVKEPYKKRVPHGIVLGPDGEKMSKSRGNVVNPDDLIERFGADAVRLCMQFIGAHKDQVPWSDQGMVGTRRFIERVYDLPSFVQKEESKKVTSMLHRTIKKVGDDIEKQSFNTAISSMMIFVNTVLEEKGIELKTLRSFVTLLAPFAPHIAEELWSGIGGKGSIFEAKWPTFDASLLEDEEITIAVQINGKVRGEIVIGKGASEEETRQKALESEKIKTHLEGKEVKKIIVIQGRIVNIVV